MFKQTEEGMTVSGATEMKKTQTELLKIKTQLGGLMAHPGQRTDTGATGRPGSGRGSRKQRMKRDPCLLEPRRGEEEKKVFQQTMAKFFWIC